MEIKKSNKANLEDERITGFLLGLILVLSVLFVSFEYTTNSSNGSELNEDLLDDISQDLEMMPQDNHDMVSYEPAAAPSKTITTNIKKQTTVAGMVTDSTSFFFTPVTTAKTLLPVLL